MHKNQQAALDALRANPEPALEFLAERFVALGAKSEWSMDDNFNTTEGIADLASDYDLPRVGGQSDEDLAYWGHAAAALGYDYDTQIDDEEDE